MLKTIKIPVVVVKRIRIVKSDGISVNRIGITDKLTVQLVPARE